MLLRAPMESMPTSLKTFGQKALSPGDIVDVAGRVLGEHQGVINYTVGQRRGLEYWRW